jgi:poly-gamma-glutamate capsule biosynthesis protein CapA/YwtB (metallophosphatase superfamily)
MGATAIAITLLGTAACTSTANVPAPASSRAANTAPVSSQSGSVASSASAPPARPSGEVTVSFAGDVHFMDRVGQRLAANPATVFAQAAPGLGAADITMVNLETAITTGGQPQEKAFTFRAPPVALTALRDAGIDVATMANNHGADYGSSGLADSLAAIRTNGFPVIGIGADAKQAFAPYKRTVNGVRLAIFAADQVHDETTLRLFSAGPGKAGVANAFSPELLSAVRAAKAQGYVVVVYVHWGTEHVTCPNDDQRTLADQLASAGATAVVGTHAHELQGAGWRSDGVFVAYGLGNYLWFKGAGDDSPDNGVLTLTFRGGKVVADKFAPSHLDDRGVPVPATGATKARIDAEWNAARTCAGLAATPSS